MARVKRRYKNWNRGKEKNDKKINYIVIIIAITMIFIAHIVIKQGIDYEKNIVPVYSYTVQKNTNYEVVLKPNDFYEAGSLPSGGYYASKAINEYKINFKYIFQGDKKTTIKYTYNITANLVGTVKENDNRKKEVWNRNFMLNENTSDESLDATEFSISKDINIDYGYYNNLARSYEKAYGLIIDSVLKVRLNVAYNMDVSNLGAEEQKIEDTIELEIPITNTISEVEENYEKTTQNTINPKIENINEKRIIYYIIGGALILGAIILIIIEVINKNKKEHELLYNYNISRILKYYRDLIVTVSNKPDLTGLKIMKLIILEDLIDVAEQNQLNIIHYEIPNKEESNLYVISNDYAFIYVVTADKLK